MDKASDQEEPEKEVRPKPPLEAGRTPLDELQERELRDFLDRFRDEGVSQRAAVEYQMSDRSLKGVAGEYGITVKQLRRALEQLENEIRRGFHG